MTAALLLALAVAGCGDDQPAETSGESNSSTSGGSSSTSAGTTTEATASSSGDATGSTTGSTSEGSSSGEPTTSSSGTTAGTGSSSGGSSSTGSELCQAEIDALAPSVTQDEGGCSVVVRLDHETLDLIGYHAHCAPYIDTFLDEQGARDLSDCCSEGGTRLNPKSDEYLWVFYAPPGDFGGVAVVTNHIVQRVFEATIIWNGTGDIQFPDGWEEPAALGADCGAAPMPATATYDLVSGGAEIDGDTVTAVWDVVGSTALPFAMQTLQRAAILRYPRTVGFFNPESAEYIVILEGGI